MKSDHFVQAAYVILSMFFYLHDSIRYYHDL